jgi:hypothetical protein
VNPNPQSVNAAKEPPSLRARDNPFAVSRVLQIRYRWHNAAWEERLARLAAMDYRGSIVGPHGSGKTTLLEDLGKRLLDAGWRTVWLRLTEERPRLRRMELETVRSTLGPKDVLLLDGAEQLDWWMWRRVRFASGAAGGFIVTSHRPGLLPVWHMCETGGDMFRSIVGELAPGHPGIEALNLSEVLARHRGNVRDALRDLYDRCARWPSARARQ